MIDDAFGRAETGEIYVENLKRHFGRHRDWKQALLADLVHERPLVGPVHNRLHAKSQRPFVAPVHDHKEWTSGRSCTGRTRPGV